MAAPSNNLTLTTGALTGRVVSFSRQWRMSALVPNLSLPPKQSDRGTAWFSCVKNYRDFRLWFGKIYTNVKKRVQSFLSVVTCPLCFDVDFTDRRLNSGSCFFMQWFCERFCWLNKSFFDKPEVLFFTKYFNIHSWIQRSSQFMISLVSRTKRSLLSFRNGPAHLFNHCG